MSYRTGNNLIRAGLGILAGICLSLSLAVSSSVPAQADSNIKGKKVIFVPISMGISLTEAWAKRMRGRNISRCWPKCTGFL